MALSGARVRRPAGPASRPSWAGPAATSLTITLNSPRTLGALTFTNTQSNTAGYILAPGVAGSLTLDNSGSTAQIVVSGGSNSISAPIMLAGSLAVEHDGRRPTLSRLRQDVTDAPGWVGTHP